jgi:hypothetical protein
VLLPGLDLHDAREVNRRYRSDICDAESIGGQELVAG